MKYLDKDTEIVDYFDRFHPYVCHIAKRSPMPHKAMAHKHSEYSEINIVEEGRATIFINDNKYEVEEGDIFFVNHNTFHHHEAHSKT